MKFFDLEYANGSICYRSQLVAYMNREAGTTPLTPVERDEYAKLFTAAPELLECAKLANEIMVELWDEAIKYRKGKYAELSQRLYTALKKAYHE